jgi:hypothetical protein
MTDTSKEAVERVICAPIIRMVDRGGQPTLDGCAAIIDTARALAAERDALRAQLQAARDEALEEAAKIVVDEGKEALKYSSEVIAKTYCDDAALKIRALKSTSAEGGRVMVTVTKVKTLRSDGDECSFIFDGQYHYMRFLDLVKKTDGLEVTDVFQQDTVTPHEAIEMAMFVEEDTPNDRSD